MSFTERVRDTFMRAPDAAAIEFEGAVYSWSEVGRAAAELEGLLRAAGLVAGMPVALVARNHAAPLAAAYALWAAGRCVTLISPALAPPKLAAEIRSLRPPVLAASAETFADPAIRAALGETGTVAVVLREGAIGASGFVDGFEHVRPGSDYRTLPDGAVEILTSGTTGEPKRIAHSVATVEKAAMSEIGVMADVEAHVEPQRRNAPFVMPYPISTAASFHLFHSVVSGRCVVLMEKFKLQGWIRAMQKHRPPAAYVPPAGVRMLLEAELPAQAFAGTLVIRTGGAPLEREAIIRLQDKYGLRVTPQYGATEYCGVVTWWPMVEAEQFHRVKLGSVGRARPDAALRIVSAQSGEPLPVGEIGLLEVQVARVGAGWMRSTDLASIDEDGFLFIRGRADDAINRGGFKILPEPLADVLRLHPAVRDAAVVGLPDARLGEVPVAAVELRDGVPAPSEAELFAHLRRHVPAFQVPVKIRIVAALPRNAMQKVVRTQVRELF